MTSNSTQPFESRPIRPIAELTKVEVVALVNRWTKLKDRFFQNDVETLDAIKAEVVAELAKEKELVPTIVLRRQSPVFLLMKEQIESKGAGLTSMPKREDDDVEEVQTARNETYLNLSQSATKDTEEGDIETLRILATDVFQNVLNGTLTDPEQIYKSLIRIGLNYEVIEMPNRDYQTDEYASFGKWHKINFSPTGYWLVEFQSATHTDITLHVPYDRREKLSLAVDWSQLPLQDIPCQGIAFTFLKD